jgi:hypothetical protein
MFDGLQTVGGDFQRIFEIVCFRFFACFFGVIHDRAARSGELPMPPRTALRLLRHVSRSWRARSAPTASILTSNMEIAR